MGAYLGPLGGLIEFVHWREKQTRRTARPSATRTTLGGSRTAFLPPREHREWAMSASGMSPERAARFELLMAGVYGPPPWQLVDPLAQVTNVLTPRMSLPGARNEHAYAGGSNSAAQIPGMGAVPAVAAVAGQIVRLALNTPVVDGMPVTASVWVRGSGTGTVKAQFLDPTGAWTHGEETSATFGAWARISVTGLARHGDTSMDIRVTSGQAFDLALPTVTWTPGPLPYSPGRGCKQVIIPEFGDTTRWAAPNLGGQRLSDYEFSVLEVGDGA